MTCKTIEADSGVFTLGSECIGLFSLELSLTCAVAVAPGECHASII